MGQVFGTCLCWQHSRAVAPTHHSPTAPSYDDIAAAFEGHPWVTNTGVSSGILHWENKLGFFDVKGATVPAAVSVFPRELYQAPRSWAEQAYPTSRSSSRTSCELRSGRSAR